MRELLLMATALTLLPPARAQEAPRSDLEGYLLHFDYAERRNMKISSRELVKLIKEGRAVLLDIRFKEEHEAWHMGFGLHLPMNELPKRLHELDRSKLIVTACPHKDRSALAMAYLKTQGFEVKYLEDGLVGLAEWLRGDTAREFMP